MASSSSGATVADVAEVIERGIVLDKFWIVTTPTIHSTLGDFCFETDAQGLARQVLGGLKPEEILGTFSGGEAARAFAVEQINAVADRLYNEAVMLQAQAGELRRRAGGIGKTTDPRD